MRAKASNCSFFVHDTVAMIFTKSQDPLIAIKVCSGNKCYFKQHSKYIEEFQIMQNATGIVFMDCHPIREEGVEIPLVYF